MSLLGSYRKKPGSDGYESLQLVDSGAERGGAAAGPARSPGRQQQQQQPQPRADGSTMDSSVMSFPAEGVELGFRNHIEDVRTFLDSRHPDHYTVFNLSPKYYRSAKFHNRVSECSWPVRQAPSLHNLYAVCKNMHNWLQQNPKNVCVIHCMRVGLDDNQRSFQPNRAMLNLWLTGPGESLSCASCILPETELEVQILCQLLGWWSTWKLQSCLSKDGTTTGFPTLLYSTLLNSTLLYSTLLYSTLPYSTLLFSTLLYPTKLYTTLFYPTLLYSTLFLSTLLYSTLPYPTLLY
ncbi:hypothetical protein TURU_169016 [Turdus rufiventris]|nr:hypothetical protein TURU_169016 [Turdus rufiventris]